MVGLNNPIQQSWFFKCVFSPKLVKIWYIFSLYMFLHISVCFVVKAYVVWHLWVVEETQSQQRCPFKNVKTRFNFSFVLKLPLLFSTSKNYFFLYFDCFFLIRKSIYRSIQRSDKVNDTKKCKQKKATSVNDGSIKLFGEACGRTWNIFLM